MTATDRTPTTRLLTLAALMLAAGVLFLRAYDVFTSAEVEPIGSQTERELTYLLEPIAGEGDVRVSIAGREARTILIMLNGEVAMDLRGKRAQIEAVLQASIDFSPDRDTLTLTQFPFARGIGRTLTQQETLELAGLGLLVLVLLGAALAPGRQSVGSGTSEAAKPVLGPLRQELRVAEAQKSLPRPLHAAAEMAEARPEETAKLVRSWMSYAED